MLEDTKTLVTVLKTLTDKDIIFYSLQVLGLLYLVLEDEVKAR